jgi:DNA-directed RNA polymerase sigma subunit (sigma70/sigma32)
VTLLRHLTPEQRQELAEVFSATARVPITMERVRQTESKLFSRLRIRTARGPHGPALRDLSSKKEEQA